MFVLQVIIEFAAVFAIAYGIYHEKELIEKEDELFEVLKYVVKHPKKVIKNIKRRINNVR